MKNSFKLKALCAALAVSAATVASATQVFMDVGVDFTNPDTGKVCPTCTGVFDQMTYKYDSKTIIEDTDNSGTISAGDKVTTAIGLSIPSVNFSSSYVTGFNPGPGFATPYMKNGYDFPNWVISFQAQELKGVVSSMNGMVPLLTYGGGIIELMVYVAGMTGGNFVNFMDLALAAGSATGVSTALFGIPDFTNVGSQYNNLIHAANGVNCAGSTGFASLAACTTPISLSFIASQDTVVNESQIVANPGGGWTIQSNHNGSLTFNVPEPSALLLMGGALLGLGWSNRRRAKQD